MNKRRKWLLSSKRNSVQRIRTIPGKVTVGVNSSDGHVFYRQIPRQKYNTGEFLGKGMGRDKVPWDIAFRCKVSGLRWILDSPYYSRDYYVYTTLYTSSTHTHTDYSIQYNIRLYSARKNEECGRPSFSPVVPKTITITITIHSILLFTKE